MKLNRLFFQPDDTDKNVDLPGFQMKRLQCKIADGAEYIVTLSENGKLDVVEVEEELLIESQYLKNLTLNLCD